MPRASASPVIFGAGIDGAKAYAALHAALAQETVAHLESRLTGR